MSREAGDDAADNRRMPVRPPKPGAALSVTVLLVGLALLGVGTATFVEESVRLGGGVEVTAQVTDIGVEEVAGSRGRTAYVPTVTFTYRFRGTEYTSDNISPGGSPPRYSDRATAESRFDFAVGDRVTAYVDPAAPGEGFLENSRSGQGLGALGFGGALALIAGGRLYQIRRRSRGPRR